MQDGPSFAPVRCFRLYPPHDSARTYRGRFAESALVAPSAPLPSAKSKAASDAEGAASMDDDVEIPLSASDPYASGDTVGAKGSKTAGSGATSPDAG